MPKRLVVCCDGTWNTADQAVAGRPCPTNVTKIALSVAERDGSGTRQRVYYHPGVGTTRWERLSGGAFGVGLSRNVFDAYRFLTDTYEPGDELFFFGFSRGAYTARSLAGLVRNCGVLRPESAGRIRDAWALYRSAGEKPAGVASALFRRAHAHEPRIRFLGVFDTVGALGIPALGPAWLRPLVRCLNRRWEFHDTALSSLVDGAFQALAIDEKRAIFEPALWHRRPGADGQEMRQVWFTGVHCDIGGGYPDTGLSDLALLWMIDRAKEYGLAFGPIGADGRFAPDPSESADFSVVPDGMAGPHDSWTKAYRLMAPVHRPIGAAADGQSHRLDGNEYVASTASERIEGDPGYRPPALVSYLKDKAGVHLEPVRGRLDEDTARPATAHRQ